MDFSYYIDFFHDGGLFSIKHAENRIDFDMCSFEITPEYNRDGIALDEEGRIRGMLSVEGITRVIVNHRITNELLEMKLENAEVLDFDIHKGRVELGIEWSEFSGDRRSDFSYIVIACDKVTWRDFPNDLTLDLNDMLAWPPHSPVPLSLPYSEGVPRKVPDRKEEQRLAISLFGSGRNRNWPPGRDCFEAIQNGWEYMSPSEEMVAGHDELRDPSTGEVWRFDRVKYGESGPHGIDHWHHLNPDPHAAQMYLDLDGIPCADRAEGSRIYWAVDSVAKAPAPLNETIDFAYYIGFFHDGSLFSIRQGEELLAFELASSQILPEHNRDGIGLDDEGCMRGSLVLQGLGGMLRDGKRSDRELLMKGRAASLLDLLARRGRIELGILWSNHPREARSDFSSLCIWCEKAFWQDAVAGLTVDLTELLERR